MAEDITRLKSQIVFGDGTFANFKSVKEVEIEEEGVKEKYYEFVLFPTLKARIKWRIEKTAKFGFQDKGQYMGWFVKRYKKDYCRPLDLSPDSSVWLLSCDYEGNFIDLYGGEVEIWKEKNEYLRKQVRTLKAVINALAYDMAKKSTNPMGYLKKTSKDFKGILDDVSAPIIANQQQGGGEQGGG